MKGFFSTLFVVCLLVGGAWLAYEPYLKPLLEEKGITLPDLLPVGEPGDPEGAPLEEANQSPAVSGPIAPNAAPSLVVPDIDLIIEEKYPMPDIIPLEEIVDEWKNVPRRAFPVEVLANEPVTFQLVIDGEAVGSSSVAPGTPLKPQSLSGDQLIIANAANPGMSTTILVEKTDFKQRIIQRYNEYVDKVRAEVMAKRSRVKQALEADPAKMAVLTGQAQPAAASDPGNPNFGPVKASLKAGDVASVTLEEAISFVWNGTETVAGDFAGTYETATVRFEVSTIFGTFPVNYKCLLKGGRVIAWIDPVTEDPV
ncbi:MAG: hypothetical protein P1U68_12280 [Verrucomicrobiales bacterium]|nr:hypothetical protein [Verrucomicrobiales bacterium]